MERNKIIGLVGLRGSGKSTALKEIVCCRDRLVVIDPLGEHRFGHVADLDEGLDVLGLVADRECFAITIQPGRGDLESAVDVIFETCFEIGDLWLAIEEVPHFATASWMPEGLDMLARMGRHRGVSVVYTAQRFAELPRRLTATTDVFVLFAQREPSDLQALAGRVGRDVAERVERLPLHGRIVYDALAGCCVAEKSHS